MANVVIILNRQEDEFSSINQGEHKLVNIKRNEDVPIEHQSVFFVPAIFNLDSALSYDGVAYGINTYLDCLKKGILDFSLFILGYESLSSFYSHCEYSDFLKCPNVHYIKYYKTEIENCLANINISSFKMNAAIAALKKVRIKSPSAYGSHHTVTNEWSIYRWSKYLGITNIQIADEIESSLYFKHLAVVNEISSENNNNVIPIFPKAKILLIDDEAEKGWGTFFDSFFSKSPIIFESMDTGDFHSHSSKEIEESAIAKINAFNPDIVILDLRLESIDFENTNDAKHFTGIRILKRIKSEINRGIQVIGFTASNKTWNYIEWSQNGHGIDDIIIKESPELSADPTYTASSITNLAKAVSKGISRAQFLKIIDEKLKDIGNLIYETDEGLYNECKHNIEVAYDLVKDYEVDSRYIAYSFLQLHQIIEYYLAKIHGWDGDSYVLKYENKIYRLLKKEPENPNEPNLECALVNDGKGNFSLGRGTYTLNRNFIESNFQMCAVLVFLFGMKGANNSWKDVRFIRNKKVVHPEQFGNVNENDFIKELDFVKFIFDKINIHLRDESEALAPTVNNIEASQSLEDNPVLASLLNSIK